MPQKLTPEIIIAAIAGFEAQKVSINTRIAELRGILGGGNEPAANVSNVTAKPRKKFSAAVRRKMALAQRARYAKLKQGSKPTQVETAKPKRKMSAAGRRNIIEATKRRWAAVKAAKQAGKPAVAKKGAAKKTAA
jgi:hypothetical protein